VPDDRHHTRVSAKRQEVARQRIHNLRTGHTHRHRVGAHVARAAYRHTGRVRTHVRTGAHRHIRCSAVEGVSMPLCISTAKPMTGSDVTAHQQPASHTNT
jgi:hypothetical protein